MGFRGGRIRELREAKGWSQKTLGEKVSVSQATISRLEKNEVEKRPDPTLALRLARALGVKLEEVWDDTDEAAGPGSSPPQPHEQHAEVDVKAYEKALYGAGAKLDHVEDVDPARAALRQVIPLALHPVDPDDAAREWLAAVAALREAGREPTPLAIATHVAMEALRRVSVGDATPTTAKTRAA